MGDSIEIINTTANVTGTITNVTIYTTIISLTL